MVDSEYGWECKRTVRMEKKMTGDTFSTQLDTLAATLLRRVDHYRELGDTKLALAADIAAEAVLGLLDALPLVVSEGSAKSEAA